MEETFDENSIFDGSFIANAISGQDLADGGLVEDENQSTEVQPLNFSPPRPNIEEYVFSPVVQRTAEFDEEQGYDTDEGPSYDAVNEEGPLIVEEGAISDNEGAVDFLADIATTVGEIEEEQVLLLISDNDINKLKVHALKDELLRRGLNPNGKKAELRTRLKEAIADRIPLLHRRDHPELQGRPTQISGFPLTAKWKILQPLEDIVVEPVNNFMSHAPTVPPEDAAFVPIKHNFAERFEREDFTGTEKIVKTYKNKKIVKNKNGIVYEDRARKSGAPNPEFLKRHTLNARSSPVKFVEAFLPVSKDTYGETNCCFELWCYYTNIKAKWVHFAGTEGYPYPDFEPFSVDEFKQHLALYFVNGLCSSPRLEMKFQPQCVDPICGNDFIFRSFSSNAERRHRHFKAFFTMRDPRQKVPDRNKEPNWKVSLLLHHMNYVNKMAWNLGENISVDEQTIGFQGHHKDKLRITYKAEGDGFQCDALCQEGYTYGFYFRNQPAPKKYLDQGHSPLHARVMFLFDSLKDRYHRCGMDNLYISAKFLAAAYKHDKKVLVAGVCRKGGRGFPEAVLQTEVNGREEQIRARGTVKAAVLEGDNSCPNLVAVSVYDTKPVHFLSMSCKSIQWIEKERSVHVSSLDSSQKMKFLRLNINDTYNKEMGHVDVSDQLRNYYRFDNNMRKRKWWWSIAFWGIGVQLVNAYILYCKVMEASGAPKKDWLSHFDFRKAVALEWISSKEEHVASKRKFMEIAEDEDNSEDDRASGQCHSGIKSINGSGSKGTQDGGLRTSSRKKAKKELWKDSKNQRSVRVSNTSLQPSGTLQKRLHRHLLHWPKEATGTRQRCTIHRWASGVEVKNNVMRCSDCEVHLCVNCYALFHMVPNLVDKKDELRELFQKEQQEKTNNAIATTPDKKCTFEIKKIIVEMVKEASTCPPVKF